MELELDDLDVEGQGILTRLMRHLKEAGRLAVGGETHGVHRWIGEGKFNVVTRCRPTGISVTACSLSHTLVIAGGSAEASASEQNSRLTLRSFIVEIADDEGSQSAEGEVGVSDEFQIELERERMHNGLAAEQPGLHTSPRTVTRMRSLDSRR